MADRTSFEFGEILSATQHLQRDLRAATARSEDPKVRALSRELDEVRIVGASSDAPPLTIAFVGQYNAGKSTILRVLTGREDIVIDSDVCTDTVTAYDWNGVRLLDTPGVHAGHPDHDERTYAVIDRADLLVFVVTNELFDDTIGHHFRELAFNRQHARRMLLVVNKMGQDPGSPETKRPDIEKVTAPLTVADFRGVFIDARSWLEAQGADDEDRADLLEIANIGALTEALNGFIAERGLAGRLSAPLFTMRGTAEQASALLSTDFPQERAALELLHRKRSILLASRGRLRTTMSGVVARAVADIGKYGDEVAEAIEPGKTEKDVEALHTAAQARASARSEGLSDEARRCVETELSELRRQLEALRDGVLARELTGQVEGGAPSDVALGGFASPAWQARSKEEVLADWPTKAKKVGNVAKEIGNWAARWATGPAAEGASAFGAAAARGSDAHKAVQRRQILRGEVPALGSREGCESDRQRWPRDLRCWWCPCCRRADRGGPSAGAVPTPAPRRSRWCPLGLPRLGALCSGCVLGAVRVVPGRLLRLRAARDRRDRRRPHRQAKRAKVRSRRLPVDGAARVEAHRPDNDEEADGARDVTVSDAEKTFRWA